MRDLRNQKKNCKIYKTIYKNFKIRFISCTNNWNKLKQINKISKIKTNSFKTSKKELKNLSLDLKAQKKDGKIER